MTGLRKTLGRLARSASGLAATEMALSMPFLLGAGLWALELSNYALATMQVNQIATHIADNTSRVGEKSLLEDVKLYESDINDLLEGASLQGGKTLQLFDSGRVIVSSLETKDGEQWIHWQRCIGKKNWESSYGKEGDKPEIGMGPAGEEVFAFDGEAVIFVELVFDYKPLVSGRFIGEPTIHSISSFTVRNSRDLSKIYQHDSDSPDPVAKCKTYDNPYPA